MKKLFSIGLLFLSLTAVAGNRSNSNGNFGSSNTWENNTVPGSNDDVDINSTVTVTANTTYTVSSLKVLNEKELRIYGRLVINNSLILKNQSNLTVYEGGELVVNNRVVLENKSVLDVNHGARFKGNSLNSLTLKNETSLVLDGIADIDVTGNFNQEDRSGIVIGGEANLNVDGNYELKNETFLTVSGSINLHVKGNFIQDRSEVSIEGDATLNVDGNYNLKNEASLTVSGSANLHVKDNFIQGDRSEVSVDGNANLNVDGNYELKNETFLTVSGSINLHVKDNFIQGDRSEVSVDGNANLNVDGNYNLKNESSLTVSGSADIDISQSLTQYYNASINFSGVAQLGVGDKITLNNQAKINATGNSDVTINSDINLQARSSELNAGDDAIVRVNGSVSGNGSVNVKENAQLGVSGNVTANVKSGNVKDLDDISNDLVANNGMVEISTNRTYSNVTINTGSTLVLAEGITLTVRGNFTNNGTLTDNGATVNLTGTNKVISGTSITTFNTVNFNGSTTLNATVEVTTEANVNGTLDTDLTHATAELVMKSNANQTAGFYNNGTLNGNIVMERYISGGKYGHYITAPVQMPINEFAPTQAAYRFNASLGRWATVNTANNFAEGLGYNIILKEETILRYKGKPNGNTVSLTLNKSNRNTGGFNLVGNPFPFPIVWKGSDALAGNGVAYVYDADKTSYEEIAPFEDFVIEPGQAFFVKAAANQATLTFSENKTSIKNTTADMSTRSFFRVMNVEPDFLKLTVNKENTDYSDKAMFLFDDNAKAGYDYNEDADNRAGWGNAPEFYSVADGKKLALNALPRITEEDTVTIPLFVNIKQAGNYSLNMDRHSLNKLPADLNINLYDSVADVSYDLRDKLVVSFTENNSNVTERFVLTLTKGVKVEEEVIVEDTTELTVDSVEVGVADTASTNSVEGTVDATETESIAIDTTTIAVVVADTVAADSMNENNEGMVADTTAVTQDTVAVGGTVAVENADSVAVDSVSVEVADTVSANSTTESELVDNTNAADTVTAEVVSADSTNGAANRGNDNKEVNGAVTGEPSQKLVDNTAFQQISATDLRLHGSNREIKIWLQETLQTAATLIVYGLNGQVYNSLNLSAGAPIEQVLSVPANGIYIVNMTFNGQTIQKRVMVR